MPDGSYGESGGGDDTTSVVVTAPIISAPGLRFVELLPPGVTSGLVISAGETIGVEAGSVLSAATILSDGAIEIMSGGEDFDTTVSSGGFSYVDDGGLANGTVISNGGFSYVDNGGLASGAIVSSGGEQVVLSGGVASTTTVGGGGLLAIIDGGSAPDVNLIAGGTAEAVSSNTLLDIGPGLSFLNQQVGNGVTLEIASGGVATEMQILSGGTEEVLAGGTDSGFGTVSAGGVEIISSGGMALGPTIDGGTLTVSSGGVASGVALYSGEVVVSSGGSVVDFSFENAGSSGTLSLDDPGEFSGLLSEWLIGDTIDFRNLALSDVVKDGSTLSFSVGAQTYSYNLAYDFQDSLYDVQEGTILTSGSDGSGGTLLGITVNPNFVGSGESLYVSPGQTTTDLLVRVGGFVGVLSGGVINATSIEYGSATVSSGGSASGTTLGWAGELVVDRGATATDSLVESGGLEEGYGNIDGTVVDSGGTIILPWASGETAATLAADKGATLQDGAILGIDVQSGTSVSDLSVTSSVFLQVEGATVSASIDGTNEVVYSGGIASATTVRSGGNETIDSGGFAQGTVLDGGTLWVSSGGIANGTSIDSGGVEDILFGGIASGTTILAGGSEIIDYGGVASGAIIEKGGDQSVSDGGTAINATIYGQVVVSGQLYDSGLAEGTRIESGGKEIVSDGGYVLAAIVDGGGLLDLEGGTASAATVSSGATLLVESGVADGTVVFGVATIFGYASGSMISNGGEMTVSSGGTANSTTILDGGQVFVSAGAIASQTMVSSGGEMVVTSGGSVDWQTTIAGGLLVLDAGAVVGPVGSFIFAGSGGVFEIDGMTLPARYISGFGPGDTIDLAGIAFAKGGTATLDSATDQLQIVENGVTYNLQFAGDMLGYTFRLTRDQSGGTAITAVAADFWAGPSSSSRSGDWSTAADWGNQHIPQSLDRVVLGGAGAYTVTNEKSHQIASLAITDTGATLDVTSGTLTLLNQSRNEGTIEIAGGAAVVDDGGLVNDGTLDIAAGTFTIAGVGTSTNAGTVTVADGAALKVTGNFTNNGPIDLNGTGDPTSLIIAGSVFLGGTGQVTLGDAAGNAIVSNGAAASLTNASNIAGSGTIGNANLALTNGANGIIDATGTAAGLTIAGAGTFKNRGTVESTGSAGLTIDGAVFNTGTLAAAPGDLTVTGELTGTGEATIADNATLTLDARVGAAQTVMFTGATGTLALALGQDFAGTVAGLADGDVIDLENFAYSPAKLSVTAVAGSTSTGAADTIVTIRDGNLKATVALLGQYSTSASGYSLTSDNRGTTPGTLLELAPPVG